MAPLVIAHRGASAHAPENTLAAFGLGHEVGADLIETDVVLTRDGYLICLHDLWLETTTDAGERFADRVRDGHVWAADLTLEEVRSLRAWGRDGRFRGGDERVPTFDELLGLVARLNAESGRSVGVIAEPKEPAWHEGRGLDVVGALVEAALRPEVEVMVQSFDHAALRRVRDLVGGSLRLVALTDKPVVDAELDELAAWCWGIGPAKRLVDGLLVSRAHERGLVVIPWTYVDDESEMRAAFALGVDGVFVDDPRIGVRARVEGGSVGGRRG